MSAVSPLKLVIRFNRKFGYLVFLVVACQQISADRVGKIDDELNGDYRKGFKLVKEDSTTLPTITEGPNIYLQSRIFSPIKLKNYIPYHKNELKSEQDFRDRDKQHLLNYFYGTDGFDGPNNGKLPWFNGYHKQGNRKKPAERNEQIYHFSSEPNNKEQLTSFLHAEQDISDDGDDDDGAFGPNNHWEWDFYQPKRRNYPGFQHNHHHGYDFNHHHGFDHGNNEYGHNQKSDFQNFHRGCVGFPHSLPRDPDDRRGPPLPTHSPRNEDSTVTSAPQSTEGVDPEISTEKSVVSTSTRTTSVVPNIDIRFGEQSAIVFPDE